MSDPTPSAARHPDEQAITAILTKIADRVNHDLMRDQLRQLRALGYRVALDVVDGAVEFTIAPLLGGAVAMLTDIACKKAACPPDRPRKRFADSLGMYLEVTPAGGRYLRRKHCYGGVEKRLALGVYPEVTLAEARQGRDAARKLIAQNIDPSEHKREQKIAEQTANGNTFEAVAGGCGSSSGRATKYAAPRGVRDLAQA